jgi:hypothetical protein
LAGRRGKTPKGEGRNPFALPITLATVTATKREMEDKNDSNNAKVPLSPEGVRVLHHELVGGDADVEGVEAGPAVAQQLARLGRAEVRQHLEDGAELLELHLPVDQTARGHDDEVRPPDAFPFLSLWNQECRERNDVIDQMIVNLRGVAEYRTEVLRSRSIKEV